MWGGTPVPQPDDTRRLPGLVEFGIGPLTEVLPWRSHNNERHFDQCDGSFNPGHVPRSFRAPHLLGLFITAAVARTLLLFLMFIMRIDVVEGAIATVTLFALPQHSQRGCAEPGSADPKSVIAMILYFAGMALAVFASAGLVAAVFEPGRIELLLSKPVSRTHLLLGRYFGNVLVVAANIIYLVAGSWIIFGIKTSVWGAGFLVSSLCTIFIFSVLLAVLVLVGVLWDSSAVAIMVTFAIIIVSLIVAQKATIERLLSSEWSRVVVRVLYYVLPKTSGRERDYQASDPEPAGGELDARVVHGAVWRRGAWSRAVALSAEKSMVFVGHARGASRHFFAEQTAV